MSVVMLGVTVLLLQAVPPPLAFLHSLTGPEHQEIRAVFLVLMFREEQEQVYTCHHL